MITEWFERWGYVLGGLLAFAGLVGYVVATTKRDPDTGMYCVDHTLLGPLASYVKRRGGLTHREVIGWGVVLALIVFIVVAGLVSGFVER